MIHVRADRCAWGHGRFGWRPDWRPNVGGGHSFGWLCLLIWTTHEA